MKKYDPDKHHRRSIRLKGYDYASPGAYFVTICIQGGECLLGEVVDGEMHMNALGRAAEAFWDDVPGHFSNNPFTRVSVDARVIMPNHCHAIITIRDISSHWGAVTAPAPRGLDADAGETTLRRGTGPTLGRIVAYYKYETTKLANEMRDTPGLRLWQRNYWEHVIRNERSYQRICQYVENNPALWDDDQLHPGAPPNPFNLV